MYAHDWFYARPDGQRAGPVSPDDLARLYQSNRIHRATPVWRDGMPDWAPLSTVATSLGLPPMPPPMPAMQAPPRRGLHWAWIVLIVLAAFSVPVIGILAAIALPAYQDYRVRAGINEVVTISAPLRLELQSAMRGDAGCSTSAAADDQSARAMLEDVLPLLRGHRHVADIAIADGDAPSGCRIEITLRGFDNGSVDGQRLAWNFQPEDGNWTCSSSISARYLPTDCGRVPPDAPQGNASR